MKVVPPGQIPCPLPVALCVTSVRSGSVWVGGGGVGGRRWGGGEGGGGGH